MEEVDEGGDREIASPGVEVVKAEIVSAEEQGVTDAPGIELAGEIQGGVVDLIFEGCVLGNESG